MWRGLTLEVKIAAGQRGKVGISGASQASQPPRAVMPMLVVPLPRSEPSGIATHFRSVPGEPPGHLRSVPGNLRSTSGQSLGDFRSASGQSLGHFRSTSGQSVGNFRPTSGSTRGLVVTVLQCGGAVAPRPAPFCGDLDKGASVMRAQLCGRGGVGLILDWIDDVFVQQGRILYVRCEKKVVSMAASHQSLMQQIRPCCTRPRGTCCCSGRHGVQARVLIRPP